MLRQRLFRRRIANVMRLNKILAVGDVNIDMPTVVDTTETDLRVEVEKLKLVD